MVMTIKAMNYVLIDYIINVDYTIYIAMHA
jgi:hypothetical protein